MSALSRLFPNATLRPWSCCGKDRGVCQCRMITGPHHPIATLTSGEWGDDYPSLRIVQDQVGAVQKEGGLGVKVEASIERFAYGNVPEEMSADNARLIVHVVNAYDAREEALREALAAMKKIEWKGGGIEDGNYCAQCGGYQEGLMYGGHASDCSFRNAITKIEAALAAKP